MARMLLICFVLVSGCAYSKEYKFEVETNTPNVWETYPKQSMKIKASVSLRQ